MKRPVYSASDSFSRLPLLALLPSLGNISRLSDLTSSLFARHEHVVGLQKSEGETDREMMRRLDAEEAMLRQVLDWLHVRSEPEDE